MKNKTLSYIFISFTGIIVIATTQLNWIFEHKREDELVLRLFLSCLAGPLIFSLLYSLLRLLTSPVHHREPRHTSFLLPFSFLLPLPLMLIGGAVYYTVIIISLVSCLVSSALLLYRHGRLATLVSFIRQLPSLLAKPFRHRQYANYKSLALYSSLIIMLLLAAGKLLYLNYTFFRELYIRRLPVLLIYDAVPVIVFYYFKIRLLGRAKGRLSVYLCRFLDMLLHLYSLVFIIVMVYTGHLFSLQAIYATANFIQMSGSFLHHLDPTLMLLVISYCFLAWYLPRTWLHITETKNTGVCPLKKLTAALLLLLAVQTSYAFLFNESSIITSLLARESDPLSKKLASLKMQGILEKISPYLDSNTAPLSKSSTYDTSPDQIVLYGKKYNVIFWTYEGIPDRYLFYNYSQPEITASLAVVCRNAVIYRNSYSIVPHSAKQNFAIHTGMYPLLSWYSFFTSKARVDTLSVSEILTANGYSTAYICGGYLSFTHKDHFFEQQAYDHLAGCEDMDRSRYSYTSMGIDDQAMTDEALAWLDKAGQPFYLNLYPVNTHHPYDYSLPADFKREKYSADPDENNYLNLLRYDDMILGRFASELKKRGLYSNTIWVFTSDHGENFGGHGQRGHNHGVFQGSIKTPIILANPILFRGQTFDERYADAVDILPTIVDLLGGKPVKADIHQGLSLVSDPPRQEAYFFNIMRTRLFGMVDKQYKLIWNLDSDGSLLFDLRYDPEEKSNLASQKPAEVLIRKKKTALWIYENIRHILPAI